VQNFGAAEWLKFDDTGRQILQLGGKNSAQFVVILGHALYHILI